MNQMLLRGRLSFVNCPLPPANLPVTAVRRLRCCTSADGPCWEPAGAESRTLPAGTEPQDPAPSTSPCWQDAGISHGATHPHSDGIFLALTNMPLTCKSFFRAVSYTAL